MTHRDDELSTTRWRALRDHFDAAVSADPDERGRIVARAHDADAEMGQVLAELLVAADRRQGETGRGVARAVVSAVGVATVPDPEPGMRVGAYELRERIGRGGMGAVFRAERRDGQVAREVAVKLLPRASIDDAALRRFMREREVAAAFDHPNFAQLHDVGETTDGTPYFVMELVRGATITAWCDARRADVDARVRLFLQVCEAVRHAHAKLVLHRDLKPGNILVTDDGLPKLIDFGIAKLLDDGARELTATRETFFTPANAAPEQVRREPVGVACDVYQLGTVLYELLCGSPVFATEALGAAEIEQRILHHVPDAPSDVAARAPAAVAQVRGAASPAALARALRGDLDAIVQRALRKEVAERYASVERLADDLRRYLALQPVLAGRGHGLYRARKFVRRHALGVGVAATIVVLTGAFVAVTVLQSQRLARERDVANAERDTAEQVVTFLGNVFRAADPNESLTVDARVGEVLDNATRELDTALREKPRVRARLYGVLSDVYVGLEDPDRAQALHDRAASIADAPSDDHARLSALERQARIWYARSDSPKTAASVREALALHERLATPPEQRWGMRELAVSASWDLDPLAVTQALVAPLRAELAKAEGDIDTFRQIVRTEVILSDLYAANDQLRESDAILAEIEARIASRLPARSPESILVRSRRVSNLDREGKVDEALALLASLGADRVAVYGEESAAVAMNDVAIGNVHYSQGRYAESLPYFERAHAKYRRVHKGAHADTAATAYNLGNALYVLGRLDEAGTWYEQAIDAARQVWGEDGPSVATFRGQLGSLRADQQRNEEAEALLRQSVARRGITVANDVYPVLTLADVLARRGAHDEALRHLASTDAMIAQRGARLADAKAFADELRAKIAAAQAR